MAHVKAGGATRQHSQRAGKRLGVKLFGGQVVKPGQIIVRQRGLEFHPGKNVSRAKDFTLYSKADGIVNFKTRAGVGYIDVLPQK